MRDINARIGSVQTVFTDKRAYANAITYQIEIDSSASGKKKKQKELEQFKAQSFNVEFPDHSVKKLTFDQLEALYTELKARKTELSTQLVEVLKPSTEAKTKRDQYLADHMVSLSPEQIAGLQKKVGGLQPEILQINIPEANIVDRCQSCHVGIREPLKLTAAAMAAGHKPDEYARAFSSHPEGDLLKIHDPEKFGCTPCHQGNGRATASVERAHGEYEHWLWPLFDKAHAEAGCQSCHRQDDLSARGRRGQDDHRGKKPVSAARLRRLSPL